MKGLLALLGKPEAASKEAAPAPADDPKATYAAEMFSALKDDDQEGFASALESYVSACMPDSEEEEAPALDDEE